ncbi:hypothetical protein ACLB1R_01055 [Escherichia coli]
MKIILKCFIQKQLINREMIRYAKYESYSQSNRTIYVCQPAVVLGIPQVALRPQFSDIAPEVLSNDGITAFLLNWQANANRTEQRGNGQSSGRDDFWLSLEPGLHIRAGEFEI